MSQNPNPFPSFLPFAHQNLSFHLQRAHDSIKNLAKGLQIDPSKTSENPNKTLEIEFTSSSIKIPKPQFPNPFPSSLPFAHQNLSSHLQRAKDSIINLFKRGPSSILCSSSLAIARKREEDDEERVLISEVLIRNKDGEVMERKDLEDVAALAIKACRPNSALTVKEVQEDVHRIVQSGLFSSCMPVAVDTRDGIRLVFQVLFF